MTCFDLSSLSKIVKFIKYISSKKVSCFAYCVTKMLIDKASQPQQSHNVSFLHCTHGQNQFYIGVNSLAAARSQFQTSQAAV